MNEKRIGKHKQRETERKIERERYREREIEIEIEICIYIYGTHLFFRRKFTENLTGTAEINVLALFFGAQNGPKIDHFQSLQIRHSYSEKEG